MLERNSREMAEESQKQHFVLVHGAGHGAWCWYKLRYHLQNSGHKVTCLDLAGAGIDPTDPNSLLSFRDYNQPLSHFLSSLPPNHKVVLVGHSAGGLSLTQALHEFGDKISLAIFVAAEMLPYGVLTEQDALDVNPLNFKLTPAPTTKCFTGIQAVADVSEHEGIYEYIYGMGPDNPPTSMYLKKEFQREMLYHMSPEEDSILASMLLRPSSITAFKTAKFTGGDVDKVRRVYIKTMNDRMAKPELQEDMIRKWPPSEVMTIDTEHSPFFSAPEELCRLLLKASNPSQQSKASWISFLKKCFFSV